MYAKVWKRLVDIIISIISIVVLSPAFVIVSIWIRLDSRGTALFKQRRIGKGKREFHILKYRTMKIDTPQNMPTHMLGNPESYITRCGNFLRKSSLDEIPQIINIIRGEMSIIGPRPALWNQYDLIAERDKYAANDIRPGLTGWAQINGRDELPIEVKAAFDGEYIKKMSFWFDIKIFFLTIYKVFKHDGVVEGVNEGVYSSEEEEVKVVEVREEEVKVAEVRQEQVNEMLKEAVS